MLYKAYGLIFRSEIELPELPEAEGKPDVLITLGKVPENLVDAIVKDQFLQASPGEFLLRLPNIAIFYVSDGNKIIIELLGEANRADIRLFLIGSVFGALLHQLGYLVLHGSAVKINGKGIIFSGISGAGKSTLAGYFDKRGYTVLADDIIAVDIKENSMPYIIPGFPNIKLWKDAADKLNKQTDHLEPVQNNMEKYRIAVNNRFSDTRLPIDRVYILNPDNIDKIAKRHLADFDKVKALIENTYRYFFLKGQGVSALHLKQCVTLCRQCRISIIDRPESLASTDDLVDFILDDICYI